MKDFKQRSQRFMFRLKISRVKYFQDLENELGNFKVGVYQEPDEYIETLKPSLVF
jgi:hypothetical protein